MNYKRVLHAFFIILWLFASTKYCFAQKQQPSANQLIDGILNSYHRDSEKDNYPRVLDSLQEVVELINDERARQYVKLVRIQHLFETATIPSQKALFLNSARNIFNETKHSEIRGFYYILRGQYAFG